MNAADRIVPQWPAPANVRAFTTTRTRPLEAGELPEEPRKLSQRHGVAIARIETLSPDEVPIADGAVTSVRRRVCAIQTADCMPLALCDRQGAQVGVVHAGWRGMAAGVIEAGVAALGAEPASVIAWMGPTIGPAAFEVGPEVREAFCAADPMAESAFAPHVEGKFLADLYALARQRLARAGVGSVFGGGYCTFTQQDRFFSHRRGRDASRMGTYIWME